MRASGRRPRLLLATDSLVPSGLGAHMLALAGAVADRFEVTVAADRRSGLVEAALRAGYAALALDTADALAMEDTLHRAAPDLLHVHAGIGWEGHGFARAGREAGIATVLRTEHLPFVLTDSNQRAEHLAAVAELDAVICVSEAARASFAAAGVPPEKLNAIRNGLDARPPRRTREAVREEFGVAWDAKLLLCVARLTEQKGHAVLLDALERLPPERCHGLLCLAVGDGPLLKPLRYEVERRGLGNHVRFLGARDDIPDLLAASDLFVLPSRFEGLPLVAIEAMAAGLPVVATRIGGTDEVVADGATGWLVEPGDPAALAGAVERALADDAGLSQVGQAGRRRYEQEFRAARMGDETAALYHRLLAEPGRPRRDHRMKTIRIGFVGAGGIAQRHLGVLETFEDVEIVGFADPDLGRAEAAAARFGARAFAEGQAMLDACAPDAVYICVPPFAHGGPERACLTRNLPFFVEKPVSLDLGTAEEIAAAVAKQNLVTAVGYHWRYLDTVDEARALLAQNPAQLLSGYWLDSTPPPQWWWREDRSGGQIVEQATHLLDLARFLVGEVREVYGRAGHKDRAEFPGLDVPTVSTASLTFDNGVVANVASTCLLGWNHRVGLHIFADRLAIELTDRDIMVDVGRGRPVRGADGDPVWREDRDFIDAVAGGENRIRCPYAEAVRTHRLGLAVMESARTGAVVRLPAEAFERPPLAPLRLPPRLAEPAPGLPPGHRLVRSLGVERPGEPAIIEYEEGPPGEGQVRLDTLYTGFSAGTELTFLKNTNPYLHSRWDGGRGVFVEGEPSQRFPVPFLGYMEVARVAEARAGGFAPGETVATTFAHKTGHTADPFRDLLVKLPAEIDPILGIYVAQMGPIAANGLLHADAELSRGEVERLGQGVSGRPVLVVGGGVVGLLTALFAARAGAAEVVVADPSPFRRERIAALGLVAMTETQAWDHAKARWHHGGDDRGADVVFQTRSHVGALQTALKALRPQGTVIDLAFYQGGADALRLGEEFHHNGLNLRCAQINRVPRGLGFTWTRRRLAGETIGLLAERGGDIRQHMITHVVPFEEGPGFLRHLVAERPDFLQIVFQVGE